uniref:Uncharacterized protein n=1 Tax=Opuntia streptacantha TaxID=393608 RepID=A0A7C9CHV3_OPUST
MPRRVDGFVMLHQFGHLALHFSTQFLQLQNSPLHSLDIQPHMIFSSFRKTALFSIIIIIFFFFMIVIFLPILSHHLFIVVTPIDDNLLLVVALAFARTLIIIIQLVCCG